MSRPVEGDPSVWERGRVLVEHRGVAPTLHATSYVAPTAVVSGDVTLGRLPGAVVGARSEVRIHGVVHVNTVLPPDSLVPIGWVAVGDPASVLPPGQHDEIWAIPGTVSGLGRNAEARERMAKQVDWFAAHRDDRILD